MCKHENESESTDNPGRFKNEVYALQLEPKAANMPVPFKERKEQDVLKSEGNMMSSDECH